MKKLIYSATLLLSSLAFSQVGINTENPQAIFHIDGKSSTQTTNPTTGVPTAAQQVDDFVVTSDGNVGVGIIAPTAKIHTISTNEYGAFQMQDGSEGTGKFLASDANGKSTWVNSPLTPVVFGNLDTSSTLFNLGANQYVRDNITLTKGKWLVYVGKLLSPASNPSPSNNVWVRLTLSSSQTSNEQSGFSFLSSQLVSGWLESVNGPNRFTFLSGVIAIEVTSTSRTLYLRTREYNTVGTPPTVRTRGDFGENYLFAVPTY